MPWTSAIKAIDKTLTDHKIDVILGPADARMASLAAVAGYGYPVASVPLGFADFNGRAFGMNIIARAGEEGKILGEPAASIDLGLAKYHGVLDEGLMTLE